MLLLIYYTQKSLSVAPISLLISFIPYIMVCFATLVIATFFITSLPVWLMSITSCQLDSLEFLVFIIYSKVISGPAVPLLAATDAYNCIGAIGVFNCAYRD